MADGMVGACLRERELKFMKAHSETTLLWTTYTIEGYVFPPIHIFWYNIIHYYDISKVLNVLNQIDLDCMHGFCCFLPLPYTTDFCDGLDNPHTFCVYIEAEFETYGMRACCTCPLHLIAHPVAFCVILSVIPCVTFPQLCCMQEAPCDYGFHFEAPSTVCARTSRTVCLPTLMFPCTCFRLCILNPCGKGEGNLDT